MFIFDLIPNHFGVFFTPFRVLARVTLFFICAIFSG